MRYTHENTSKIGQPKDVYLDGVKIDNVQEADDTEGWLIRCVLDADGYIQAGENGDVVVERLTGKVMVVPFGAEA